MDLTAFTNEISMMPRSLMNSVSDGFSFYTQQPQKKNTLLFFKQQKKNTLNNIWKEREKKTTQQIETLTIDYAS
jgi:hypothetical protein